MRIDKRWLWLPPVLGLLLVMGPLRPGEPADADPAADGMGAPATARREAQTGSALQALGGGPRGELSSGPRGVTQEPQEPANDTRSAGVGTNAPDLPGLLELGVTLAGVLGLGALGLYALARLRGKQGFTTDGPARIRQTLRLTAKSTLHVVEFDGRTILVGAGEQGVTLLGDAGATAQDDEAALAERDDGVVLRDMVIPRPDGERTPAETRPTPRSRADAFREALEAAGSQR